MTLHLSERWNRYIPWIKQITQVDSRKINETLRTLLHLQIMKLKLEAHFQRQV